MNPDNLLDFIYLLIFDNSRQFQKEVHGDFRKVVKKCLDGYIGYLSCINDLSESLLEEIKSICSNISKILDLKLRGFNEDASFLLNELMTGYEGNSDQMFLELNSEMFFYRMRVCERHRKMQRHEIFHIPFSQIRNVGTQRYSSPGLPCIYLGSSLYGCWEEMHRPQISTALVAKFQYITPTDIGPQYLLDLRIPDLEILSKDVNFYLKFLPLIIVCTIPVSKYDGVFKVEYVIPQMMLSWIIKNGIKHQLLGITYTSSFYNSEFFKMKNGWENYVFPVQTISEEGDYCAVLTFLFALTKPTCYEYEQIRGNVGNFGFWNDGIEDIERWEDNSYKYSPFARLEHILDGMDMDLINNGEIDI